jgi:hypothetical protein
LDVPFKELIGGMTPGVSSIFGTTFCMEAITVLKSVGHIFRFNATGTCMSRVRQMSMTCCRGRRARYWRLRSWSARRRMNKGRDRRENEYTFRRSIVDEVNRTRAIGHAGPKVLSIRFLSNRDRPL